MAEIKPIKTYVPVQVIFDKNGNMKPSALAWEDGTVLEIDRVLAVKQAAAMKAGGQGDRYTIMINGHQSYLFFERSPQQTGNCIGRWFVERRVSL